MKIYILRMILQYGERKLEKKSLSGEKTKHKQHIVYKTRVKTPAWASFFPWNKLPLKTGIISKVSIDRLKPACILKCQNDQHSSRFNRTNNSSSSSNSVFKTSVPDLVNGFQQTVRRAGRRLNFKPKPEYFYFNNSSAFFGAFYYSN